MLTQSRLKELLNYDPNTGIFTNKTVRSNFIKINNEAGSIQPSGYRAISVDNKDYRAHRLVWLYIHGYFPKNQIDHINGVRDDNRLSNLREATRAENGQNQRKPSSNNKCGYLGVYFHKAANKWAAEITINYKKMYLGLYPTGELAYAAYLKAKRSVHPFSTT